MSGQCDHLLKATPRKNLGNTWTVHERSVQLPTGDEELARKPDGPDIRIPVVLVDECKAALTKRVKVSGPHDM